MNEERLGSPIQFAKTLAEHLAGLPGEPQSVPCCEDLERLIEVTFYASLHQEEGRNALFNLAWQPSSLGCSSLIEIATPLLVTPNNLAKLAPATQREATSIAVKRAGSDLVAWALLQRNAALTPALTIWVLAPGVLRVDYVGIPRALYARGEFWLSGADHLQIQSPARVLTRTFSQWCAEADPAVEIDLRAAVVTRIAARALEHGHGGMILLVPSTLREPAGVRVHYQVGQGHDILAHRYAQVTHEIPREHRLERLIASRERAPDGRVYVRDEIQIAFAEAIEFVARLTAIDNAVLLDTDLRVRGFGVQVIEADAPQLEFTHANPYLPDVHVDNLSTFKGTRHPAGVIFCMRQPSEAAALIASQDRRLSLATKDARGGVEVLGSYERAFGWR